MNNSLNFYIIKLEYNKIFSTIDLFKHFSTPWKFDPFEMFNMHYENYILILEKFLLSEWIVVGRKCCKR